MKEVSLKIEDMKQENKSYISALILHKNLFNMSAQLINQKN